MNLAQALGRGLIASAIVEPRRRRLTLDQCKSKGTVSVRVHSADLPDAPTDYSAGRERMRRRRAQAAKVRAPRSASQVGLSQAERICGAIREAGRRLYWREIEQLADIGHGGLGPMVRKLRARGMITRTGRARHYLYGLPGME